MTLRSILIFLTIISVFVSKLDVSAASASSSTKVTKAITLAKIDQELRPKLSAKASIVHISLVPTRYSDYYAPQPGTIVNVATENDVVQTVKYCIKNNLKFLAQGGGHGWTKTFKIGQKDVLINMRGLNKITLNAAKDQITFGGGSLVSEVADAAYKNNVQTVTSTCNCVGITAAALGGGYSRFIGHYGMIIDNILCFNLVTADGNLMTVTPSSSPDLWWALRGAGANFGIVTSTTLKAYPPINNNMAWMSDLIFTPDKLEVLVQTLSDFKYTKDMFVFLFFVPLPPTLVPGISVNLWYSGPAAEARAAFKAIYDVGPVVDLPREVPYNQFNSAFDAACVTKGGRKPAHSVYLNKLDPQAFRQIFTEYATLLTLNPALVRTTLAIELYSSETSRKFPEDSAAFPHRSTNFLALVTPWYDSAIFDPIAEKFAEKVRKLWIESSGLSKVETYVNYGRGDEDLGAIYGNSLPRLKELKNRWDPNERFSQFFPIPKK